MEDFSGKIDAAPFVSTNQDFIIHDYTHHSILQMRKFLSSIFREQNFMLFRLPNQLIADWAADRYSFGTRKLSPGFMVANGHLRELTSGIGMSCSMVALNFTLMFSPSRDTTGPAS